LASANFSANVFAGADPSLFFRRKLERIFCNSSCFDCVKNWNEQNTYYKIKTT